MENEITSRKKTTRLAGLLYLIWILTGLYGMFYIPSRINLEGDAASSAQNILSHDLLFRTSILNDLISSAVWVFMVFVFYRLFKSVDERVAKLLVALVIVQIPIVFIAESFSITALLILKGELLNTFELRQRQELAMLLLKINEYGAPAFEVYWGLWLLPLAILVYRSHFLPRFLGVWLAINGLAFLVLSITSLLLAQYKDMVFSIAVPAMLGEVAFMLWLLIKGAKSNGYTQFDT